MEFSNTGGMRSPFSPRVRQSIAGRKSVGMSARRNQGKLLQSSTSQTGDVIYKTPMSTYETYGAPLPVMVTEALTFASGDVSVRISPCGWCWLVAGRRVLAWPRTPRGEQAAPARDLTLPQTDLAHKADLVEMFYEDGAQMPSMVGVSPEGVVRYWWSVGHESASVDVSCELAGQEGHRLLAARHCLLLATTTCSVLLLTARRLEGRATVGVRVLRPPSGWLGGLGRRVSLLFFGSMPHADTKLVGVVLVSEGALGAEAEGEGGPPGGGAGLLAVLGGGPGGPLLQLWAGTHLDDYCLRRLLADRHPELGGVELTALDVRAGPERSLLVLLALEPDQRYALAQLCVCAGQPPRVLSVRTLRAGVELGPRLLPLPPPPPPPAGPAPAPAALLYGRAGLARLGPCGGDKVDAVEVACEGDSVLAAEVCDGVPLVFSRKHGLLALRTTDQLLPSVCDSPLDSPCPSDMYEGNLSLYEIDPHEVAAASTDAGGKLKAAFLMWLRRDDGPCAALVAQLGAAAAALAARLARQLLDDAPAGDPRWPAPAPLPLGASAALTHHAQLRDKARALALYRAFLRARLAPALPPAEAASLERSLSVLAGELAMVRELRRLHDGPDADLITAAIYQVVSGADETAEVQAALAAHALSAADVFYCRVTAARRLLPALAAPPPGAGPAAAHAALATQMLAAAQQARCQWGEGAAGSDPDVVSPLLQLVRHTLNEARQCAQAGPQWQAVEAAAALADHLLADHHHHHQQQQHQQQQRSLLIRPFVEAGHTERARVLAEKYGDYELLVELCLQEDDMDRLFGYMDKYADEGVPELSFERAVAAGGRSLARLLRAAGGGAGRRLDGWLRAAPRGALLAARRLAAAHPATAAGPLADYAQHAPHLPAMMTAASLGKLCLLTSEECGREEAALRRRLDALLALAEQHQSLPRDIRLHHGLDHDRAPVLTPDDIVQMYVSSDSSALTEYDYKKALDLTELVEDLERRDQLRLKVWLRTVVRDSWDEVSGENVLRDKLVFRLAALVLLLGGDLELSLPPLQELVSAPELSHLSGDPKFLYLLQYGYRALLHDDEQDALAAA